MMDEGRAAEDRLAEGIAAAWGRLERELRKLDQGAPAARTRLIGAVREIRRLDGWLVEPSGTGDQLQRIVPGLVACLARRPPATSQDKPQTEEAGQRGQDARRKLLAYFYRLQNLAVTCEADARARLRVWVLEGIRLPVHDRDEEILQLARLAAFAAGPCASPREWRASAAAPGCAGRLLCRLEVALSLAAEGEGSPDGRLPDADACKRYHRRRADRRLRQALRELLAALAARLDGAQVPCSLEDLDALSPLFLRARAITEWYGCRALCRALLALQVRTFRALGGSAAEGGAFQPRAALAVFHALLSRDADWPSLDRRYGREGRLPRLWLVHEDPSTFAEDTKAQECWRRECQLACRGIAVYLDKTRNAPASPVDDALVTEFYKLQLHARALRLPHWRRLLDTAWRLLLWHRGNRTEPAAILPAVLSRLAALLSGGNGQSDQADLDALYRLELDLIRLLMMCQRQLQSEAAAIFRRPGGDRRMNQLPGLLGRNLRALLQVREADTIDWQVLAPRAPALRQELVVLEKGAASLRMAAIETQACALLLAYEELLFHNDQRMPLPGALLTAVHGRLHRMLDQAAAWREVDPPDGQAAGLQRWAESREGARPGPGGDGILPLQYLLEMVRHTLRHTCACLDRRAHLDWRPARGMVPAALVEACEAPLTALVRHCLIRNFAAAPQRRDQGLPLAPTLGVQAELDQGRLRVDLWDDWPPRPGDAEGAPDTGWDGADKQGIMVVTQAWREGIWYQLSSRPDSPPK